MHNPHTVLWGGGGSRDAAPYMHVCMYVCMYVCTSVYIYIYIYIIYTYTYICVYVCLCIYKYMYVILFLFIYLFVRLFIFYTTSHYSRCNHSMKDKKGAMSRPWPTGGMSVVHEATLMCTLLSKAWPRQGQNPHSLFEFAGSTVSNLTF